MSHIVPEIDGTTSTVGLCNSSPYIHENLTLGEIRARISQQPILESADPRLMWYVSEHNKIPDTNLHFISDKLT